MGGNVGGDHRGRHVQANPISPSWDVFGWLWLLRGWLARSVYGASPGGGMCTCVDACLALFRLRHSGGAVCRVVKRCSWFAEVPERNVTSFGEEGNLLQRMASLGEEYVLVSMPVWHCFGCCGIAVAQNAVL